MASSGIGEAILRDVRELGGHRNDGITRARDVETTPEHAREIDPRAFRGLELREARGDEHRLRIGLERVLEEHRRALRVARGRREVGRVAEERGACLPGTRDAGERGCCHDRATAIPELARGARENDGGAGARGIDGERGARALRRVLG